MSLTPYTREFGPLFDRWFDAWGQDLRPATQAVFPPVDATSDEDGVTVRFEVPGVPPESIHIEAVDRVLTIRAEPNADGDEKASYANFRRSIRMPSDGDADRAEARHEYGVLTVHVPRSEAAKPRQIEVMVQ